jgi:hypothetical protein
LTIAAAAVAGMTVYARRSIQASIKVAADQVGDQWEGLREESTGAQGSETAARVSSSRDVRRGVTYGGGTHKDIVDQRGEVRGGLEDVGPDVISYSEFSTIVSQP